VLFFTPLLELVHDQDEEDDMEDPFDEWPEEDDPNEWQD
jgi:hypothetical protein